MKTTAVAKYYGFERRTIFSTAGSFGLLEFSDFRDGPDSASSATCDGQNSKSHHSFFDDHPHPPQTFQGGMNGDAFSIEAPKVKSLLNQGLVHTRVWRRI